MDNSNKGKKHIITTVSQHQLSFAHNGINGNPLLIPSTCPESLKRTMPFPLTSAQPSKQPKKMFSHKGVNVNTYQKNNHYQSDYKQLLNEFEDYEKMLESGNFSDIKLIVGNNKIKAHKNVLAARSPYFSDILTRQDCLNIFEVKDIDYETVKIVIRYIYCAKLDDFNLESAKKILMAAKTFILPGLTEKSKKVIIDQIAVDNIFELASFSESAKEEEIKDRIIDFVKNNITKFKETDLMKFNSEILAKVIGKIIDCHALN